MPSIQDVADLAGVSTATVSRALSGNGTVSVATREKVATAAEEIGRVEHRLEFGENVAHRIALFGQRKIRIEQFVR